MPVLALTGTNDPPLQFEPSCNGNYTILEPPVFAKFVFQTKGLRGCSKTRFINHRIYNSQQLGGLVLI